MSNSLSNGWNAYKNYVGQVILPGNQGSFKDISYWRNQVFCDIITYVTPVSILALLPSVFMAVRIGLPVIAISDLVAFSLLIIIMIVKGLPIAARKIIVFGVFYGLLAVLLYYRTSSSTGMLFLLTLTVIAALIFSPKGAYYAVLISTIICVALGIVIYGGINAPFAKDKNLGLWIAISSNLLLLGLICAHCMNLLLKGLEATLSAKNISEGNLRATIENTDAYFYSIDRQFRYITFNRALKNSVKANYNVDVKPGDVVFDFLEKSAPEDARFWKDIYSEAFSGKTVRFEKDFDAGNFHTTTHFSLNPILNGNHVIGLSCLATDITELKQAQLKVKKLNDELELKVTERTAELVAANQELAFERDERVKRAAELIIANKELVYQNEEKAKRASELAILVEELRIAQQNLLATNKDLEAFTGTVSHDLRAPARAIIKFAEIIRQDFGDKMGPKQNELFQYIEESGHRMTAIIDDLLKLARYGNEQLKLEPVGMTSLVQNTWMNISRFDAHQAKLELQELDTVKVDMSMMQQVVVNLLSNAIKYSSKKEKPVIKVWCERQEDNVTFYFKDNGAGFDMKNYYRLFGVFQRFHSVREFAGTGVGLSLVKRIIEKHNGTVGAEAKVNEGATFYFTLPII